MNGGAVIGATWRGRTVGQSTVDDQCSRAVDVGNGDQRLVQRRVTAITNEVIQVLLIRVLVAATGTVLLAETGNRECLVSSIGIRLINVRFVTKPVRVPGIVSRKSFKCSCKRTYEKW